MSYSIHSVSRSACGLVKPNNEDSFVLDRIICQPPANVADQALSTHSTRTLQWYAVFDGIGGGPFGEVASFAAAEALLTYGNSVRWMFPNGLRRLINQINKAVNEVTVGTNGGCTAAIAFVYGKRLVTVHAGDSRIYLFREKCLTRLTKDHKPDRLNRHSKENRHAISRYLGMQTSSEALCTISQAIELHEGDRVLVCSDGLTDMVKDTRIFQRLALHESLEAIADLLLEDALRSGGTDNITIVIAEVEGKNQFD